MMAASPENQVIHVTPSPDSLVIKHCKNHGVYTCTEVNCSYTTHSPSLLGLHKACVHKITTGANRGEVKQYFCPAPSCHFKPVSGRCFKSLDSLRTHYTKVHGEKKFKCCKCEKAFGLERECLYHERECGQNFTCPDCGKVYNNKKALLMHCAYKGHTKPKPPDVRADMSKKSRSKSQPKQKPPQARNGPLAPLLPKVPALIPASSNNGLLASSGVSIISPNSDSKLLIHNNQTLIHNNQTVLTVPMPVSAPLPSSTPPTTSLASSHSDSQSLITPVSMSSQPTVTYLSSQSGLSILDKAIQSSKICAPKMSHSTKKSSPKVSSTVRKRKATMRDQSTTQRREPKSRITVATLTDFPRNTGSQTIYSIFQNQQKASSLNQISAQDKNSIYTQTLDTGEIFYSVNNSFKNHSNNHHLVSLTNRKNQHLFHPNVASFTDSVTQTVFPHLTVESKAPSNNPAGLLEPLKQFSNFQTQTQQIPALDSATQTLQLNFGLNADSTSHHTATQTLQLHLGLGADNTSHSATQTLQLNPDPNTDNASQLLEELLTESERNDVDTQTFGSFFSDMMTQTFEDLASDPSPGLAQDCPTVQDVLNISDMTTQTFDQMMDNNTQTFNLDISDCMTQTTFTNENMTQTLSNFVVDTTTQTFGNPFLIGAGSADSSKVPEILVEKGVTSTSSYATAVQTGFENEQNTILKHSSNGCNTDSVLMNTFSQSSDLFSQALPAYTPICTSVEGPAQMVMDQNIQPCGNLYSDQLTEEIGSMLDGSTQTIGLSDEDLALETLLSDMATQTFESDDSLLSGGGTFLDPARIFPLNSVNYTSLATTDFSSQTPDLFYSHNRMYNVADKSLCMQSPVVQNKDDDIEGISFGEAGELNVCFDQNGLRVQAETQAQWKIPTQSLQKEDCQIQMQSSSGLWEMGTQTTGTDELWEMGTQTGMDEILEIGTQTGIDEILEMGTQTGTDELWEMGTQTGVDEILEMGTQTGVDEILEMGTQTGMDELWEMGTQTGTDELWEMGTQTGMEEIFEIGTQTGTDDLFEIGTQTRTVKPWEMGTQTEREDLGEKETQTQTFIDLWEIGTQTGTRNQEMIQGGLSLTVADRDCMNMTGGVQTQTQTEDLSWERQLDIDIQKACDMEAQVLQAKGIETASKGKRIVATFCNEGAKSNCDTDRPYSQYEHLKNPNDSGTGGGKLFDSNGFGAIGIGTQTEDDFSQHMAPQLSWEMGTQTVSFVVTDGET